jgi:hypothetical protein
VWERNVHKKAASVIAIAGSFIWLHLHAPPLDVVVAHAACRPSEGIISPLRGDLCTILDMNFGEYLFHALG